MKFLVYRNGNKHQKIRYKGIPNLKNSIEMVNFHLLINNDI